MSEREKKKPSTSLVFLPIPDDVLGEREKQNSFDFFFISFSI
jgi:hypothetical protein